VFNSRETVHCGTLVVLKSGWMRSLPSTCCSSKWTRPLFESISAYRYMHSSCYTHLICGII